MNLETLTLYHFESCPFCQRVRHYLAENNIKIAEKDIQKDPSAREDLIKLGGKSQVPCLDINGTALYESMDIINYFKENKAS